MEDATGVGASVTVTPAGGSADVSVTPAGPAAADRPLQAPLRILWDLIEVSRGSTVRDEQLGTGDATAAGQDFTLAKSPVTYLTDAPGRSGDGWSSTIVLTVGGRYWTEVPSLFGRGPDEAVFETYEDDQGRTHVRTGTGETGRRLPTGAPVTASYRVGSGAAVPPPARSPRCSPRCRTCGRVRNPVPPSGGADPEPATQIRRLAPRSALTFGRAISVDDYATVAAAAPGVSRAAAVWEWDPAEQRPMVRVYVGDDDAAVTAARHALRRAGGPQPPGRRRRGRPAPDRPHRHLAAGPELRRGRRGGAGGARAPRRPRRPVRAGRARPRRTALPQPDRTGAVRGAGRDRDPPAVAQRGRDPLHLQEAVLAAGAAVRPRARRVLHPPGRRPRRTRGERCLKRCRTATRRYYAGKLWNLLPAAYRAADSETLDAAGPLRELLARIGASMAVVRRSIDRLWEDQSIETCDSWVIPYLAELLATNLVPSMDARGQRLDVANTIYYRRRKGTVALLEQLAHDVTGYEARVIEFFRRLARNRHGLDPEIGRPADAPDPAGARALQRAGQLTGLLTGTPAGGWADLRNPLGAALTGGAFDEYHHRVDVRPGRGDLGWYGISKVGFFLWRTVALAVDRATPVPVTGCPGHFAFDPTGRQIPLFTPARRGGNDYGESWVPVGVWQLPMPLTTPLWEAVSRAALPDPGPPATPTRTPRCGRPPCRCRPPAPATRWTRAW